MTSRLRRDAGFSLVEVLVALAIFAVAVVPVLYVAAAAQRLARSQPEATDLQQRLRVVATTLQRDLAIAGAGALHGSRAGTLGGHVAAIVPARIGLRLPDVELSAFSDRLSVIYVPDGGTEAILAARMPNPSAGLWLDTSTAGCGAAGLCGFTEGTRALVLDPRGPGAGHEIFTVTGISATNELAHDAPNPSFSRSYDAGAIVVPVVQRVYYFDRTNRRLMLYDGYQSDMPLVDNVVGVSFEFFGDASPASLRRPPDGEGNCVYDAGFPPMPLLADLGGSGLRRLPLELLTDGPACGLGPNRFDGDLLRVRMIRVTLRFQASADDVRGTGGLFTRPGRSTTGYSYVPDYEVTFDVAPRNLLPAGRQ
jgi:prepilin-type N-terminal cleavage/methylation domain-containing protein